jgi:RNA methyltransferase, TrmH family
LKLLTLARDLKRRKGREREEAFVAEGVRAVEELLRSSLRIRGVIFAPQLNDAPRGRAVRELAEARGIEIVEVGHREFSSAADTESPQGILGIADIPGRDLRDLEVDPSERATIVVLDAVQDPGNVGTIIRTAAALGAVATVALPGTVDPWNAKVVRSAMGAQFHHPVFSSTSDGLTSFLESCRGELWVADGEGVPLQPGSHPGKPVALAVGNEGAGVTDGIKSLATRVVSIPITGEVESLNVAVATGILLHQLSA